MKRPNPFLYLKQSDKSAVVEFCERAGRAGTLFPRALVEQDGNGNYEVSLYAEKRDGTALSETIKVFPSNDLQAVTEFMYGIKLVFDRGFFSRG